MTHQKRYLIAAAGVLLAAIAATIVLVRTRPTPKTVETAVRGHLVRTAELKKETKTFWVSGFGTVRPKTEVTIVPQVSGRVVRRLAAFRNGGFVKEGDVLFEIDPKDFELVVAQRRAQIVQLEADLARLHQEKKNDRADLEIAERHLKVVRDELERNRKLRRQGVISEGQYDASLQNFLRQERTVRSIQSALDLIPSTLAQKRAALQVARTQLDEALLNLGRTKYLAPFDGRVSQASVEVGDYLQAGQTYGKVHDMSVVEVPVSIPIEDARWAFRRLRAESFPRTQEEVQRFFPSAEVLWTRLGQALRWDGRVTRVESGLDEATRTLTLVVEVPEPLKGWAPGVRPPLIAGMFVKVRIQGITLPDVFVIPRSALREGDRLYLLKDGRLEIRPVQVLRKGQDEAVILNGVEEGEQLVLSAIPTPVEGMLLRTANGRGGRLAERPSP